MSSAVAGVDGACTGVLVVGERTAFSGASAAASRLEGERGCVVKEAVAGTIVPVGDDFFEGPAEVIGDDTAVTGTEAAIGCTTTARLSEGMDSSRCSRICFSTSCLMYCACCVDNG